MSIAHLAVIAQLTVLAGCATTPCDHPESAEPESTAPEFSDFDDCDWEGEDFCNEPFDDFDLIEPDDEDYPL